jgi:hypothetical protein
MSSVVHRLIDTRLDNLPERTGPSENPWQKSSKAGKPKKNELSRFGIIEIESTCLGGEVNSQTVKL